MTLPQLRQRYHDDLFGRVLPFWAAHGMDWMYGGVMHSLDYDGSVVSTNKLTWFQGRAIWVYSFLYNRLARDPSYLEFARHEGVPVKTCASAGRLVGRGVLTRRSRAPAFYRRFVRNVLRRGRITGVCVGHGRR